jgi:hypothetical protein
MIDYSTIKTGDKVKIVGMGAPGYANNGDIVEVIETGLDFVRVKDESGNTASFHENCGAARLELVQAVQS